MTRFNGQYPSSPRRQGPQKKNQKTYNTGYSLVVTDPTTNPAVRSLTMGEQTGSRIFFYLWSYVTVQTCEGLIYLHMGCVTRYVVSQQYLPAQFTKSLMIGTSLTYVTLVYTILLLIAGSIFPWSEHDQHGMR